MDYQVIIRKSVSAQGFMPSMAELLIYLYGEPHRHYHGLVHLAQLIERVKDKGIKLSYVQWLALYFHDAVSNLTRPKGENERQSAELLRVVGPAYHVTHADIQKAMAIILDTIDHQPTAEGSGLVLDLDMAGLAKPWEDFLDDSVLVYREVESLVTWEEYGVKRADFFRATMAHDRIFHTPEFQQEEKLARENMQRVVDSATK